MLESIQHVFTDHTLLFFVIVALAAYAAYTLSILSVEQEYNRNCKVNYDHVSDLNRRAMQRAKELNQDIEVLNHNLATVTRLLDLEKDRTASYLGRNNYE